MNVFLLIMNVFLLIIVCLIIGTAIYITIVEEKQRRENWEKEGENDAMKAYRLTKTIPNIPDENYFPIDSSEQYVANYLNGFKRGVGKIKAMRGECIGQERD